VERLRGPFGQAAGVGVVVVGWWFEVDADADAAGAEEAIVPFTDGGVDALALFGLVDVDGGADAVEVGFGVAPAGGLGASVVMVVVAGVSISGRHGFGPQLAVDDLFVGAC